MKHVCHGLKIQPVFIVFVNDHECSLFLSFQVIPEAHDQEWEAIKDHMSENYGNCIHALTYWNTTLCYNLMIVFFCLPEGYVFDF